MGVCNDGHIGHSLRLHAPPGSTPGRNEGGATETATTPGPSEPADGATPSVTLRSVVKRFGNFTAVDSIDLEIAQGEFFTLLGPSGCGKTTTLRMIAGFEEPDGGEILIDGADVARLPAHKRPTNTVFQSYALFPHLSVKDNVAYGLKRKGVDKAESERRVKAELERVGLWSAAGRRPNQLSGGQQQRVALARAVVNLPKVLLLDEPLGALDLKLRKGLQLELKGIQQDIGITFVYVTHDQEEALTMSDRIAVMNAGVVEQIGDPEEVYERPATTFVAGFIGVSNLMPGTVRSCKRRCRVGRARGRGHGRCAGERTGNRRRVPRRRPAGEAGRHSLRGRLLRAREHSRRRGGRRELDLSRHLDPARRRATWRSTDDRARPERERGRTSTSPGWRSQRAARLDPGAHPPRSRVGCGSCRSDRGRVGDSQ